MKHLLFTLIAAGTCFFSTFSAHAELHAKTRAGMGYALGFSPGVSRIIDSGKVIKLDQFHRASLGVDFPINRYLVLGFAFDYTLAISPLGRDPNLDITHGTSRISTTLLGASFLLKPQLPITLGGTDLIFYASLIGGFGASTPITMGTQPLSNYEFAGTKNIPTPFPLYLESSPEAGVELFFAEKFGIGLGAGYRVLWVVHPMVYPDGAQSNPTKDNRSAIWYDVTSFYAMATLKLAF